VKLRERLECQARLMRLSKVMQKYVGTVLGGKSLTVTVDKDDF